MPRSPVIDKFRHAIGTATIPGCDAGDAGTEFGARPGDITTLRPGHDAGVMGEKPVRIVDWPGASDCARG